MAAWGFAYRSLLTWVKDRAGLGFWVSNRVELLLIGTKGRVPAPAPGEQPPQVVEAPRGRHSEKPRGFLRSGLKLGQLTISTRYQLSLMADQGPKSAPEAPAITAPRKTLCQCIDLVVVATGKRQQLRDELLKPRGLAGEANRAAGKQIGLRDHARAFVALRLSPDGIVSFRPDLVSQKCSE